MNQYLVRTKIRPPYLEFKIFLIHNFETTFISFNHRETLSEILILKQVPHIKTNLISTVLHSCSQLCE